MKVLFPVLLLFVCVSQNALSQKDSSVLLKEAEMKLQDHTADVSSLLSNKAYELLHPVISFREMIQKHASANVLTITTSDEPGKKIKVVVFVRNKDGQPVPNALVYLYQTDYRGWYAADAPHVPMNEGDYRHARLFGYVNTDKNGRFELHTIKPSGYPQSDLPAHIHVHVSAEGYQSSGTEFLFQDDERLKGEILNRAIIDGGIIGVPGPVESPYAQKFSYEIKLTRK